MCRHVVDEEVEVRRSATVTVKRMFDFAVEQKFLAENPSSPPRKRRNRVMVPEERPFVYEAIRDEQFREFVFAMLETGCRPGEVMSVTAADVARDCSVWALDENKTDRTGAARVIYLTPAMQELTRKLMKQYPEGPLFRSTRRFNGVRRPWTCNGIRCRFKRLREKFLAQRAELPPERRPEIPDLTGLTAYVLRHTYATQAMSSNSMCPCRQRPPTRWALREPSFFMQLGMRIMRQQADQVPGLDLVLDPTLHQVTRGRRRPVDFGGNCRRWAVLAEGAKCYPGYCSKQKLIGEVWAKSDPAFPGIEDGTIYSTVSAARDALRSLGVTITYTKGLGYRLHEIRPQANHGPPTSTARRPPSSSPGRCRCLRRRCHQSPGWYNLRCCAGLTHLHALGALTDGPGSSHRIDLMRRAPASQIWLLER